MSERLFLLLLRLYPSEFRRAYGDEALQLFRDRSRDEPGFWRGARLWLDLTMDFAVGVPREYLRPRAALPKLAAEKAAAGTPSFFVLTDRPPRADALVTGGVAALLLLAAMSLSLVYASRNVREARMSFGPLPNSGKSTPEDAAETANGAEIRRAQLDANERRRVVEAAIHNVKEHYFSKDTAERISESLREHVRNGDYDRAPDGETLATVLTTQMRKAGNDPHLELIYSAQPLPQRMGPPAPEEEARHRSLLRQQNCTIEKVERLEGNIGYLKLNSFPEVSACAPNVQETMASLNGANAIIFDLRDNRGGFPDMVAMVAAYLFDHPAYLFNPKENPTERSWTKSPMVGSNLGKTPVYILTSSRTISGAEQFCYDLKMLKRATIVGERTGGAAHAGEFYRIDDHFGVAIPQNKPINQFGASDWEGVGVEPDVKVQEADALKTAVELARSKRTQQHP